MCKKTHLNPFILQKRVYLCRKFPEMNRIIFSMLLLFCAIATYGQGSCKGKVLDKNGNTPLEYVNISIKDAKTGAFIKGAITDIDGNFNITDLPNGSYRLEISSVGYREQTRQFSVTAASPKHSYPVIYLSEDSHTLQEVVVTGQKQAMRLEVDRKTFDVSQLITNAGDAASDLLENIPSVEVDNDGNISLRGNESVEVWINGKSSGLTTDNRAQILQQLPAESIERIEVIDNPSAKFSAEGSAGIINIILKKDRKAGYYGSVQAGTDTRKGANTSLNINYNSSKFDTYFNIGYRHRSNKGASESQQLYYQTNTYQNYVGQSRSMGNNLFTRAGVTWHATDKDDFTLSGMLMKGGHKDWSSTPYHYGTIGATEDNMLMLRNTHSKGDMNMFYGEFNYRHTFSDKHFIDFVVNANRWLSNNDNVFQDQTDHFTPPAPSEYSYQYRPMDISNRRIEVKLDYENQLTERLKLEAGYQANFSHENTPQQAFIDETSWEGLNPVEDQLYFNRFIYDMDLHAGYLTTNYKFGKLSAMLGLRGEYWKVNTESYTWEQERNPEMREPAFKKDYFELFPSLFLSYQITQNDQLQLNYTRRLRRPWGGQLNSFRDTRDATRISFGNPLLTPEFSNSFSLNYLRTWTEHSLLFSLYYRPTTDVMQRINWQNASDGIMYQTNMNLAKSQSSGAELTLKNKLFRILDLTTNVNAYYYKLDGFQYLIDGQTVVGEGRHSFTWNARSTASLRLPYDISVQLTGNFRSRQAITQGYRKPSYGLDFGFRKHFFNKALSLSVNCRDLLDSRRWENYTESDTFWRHQMNRRRSRTFRFTLTYNFGNMKKKQNRMDGEHEGEDDQQQDYNSSLGEE